MSDLNDDPRDVAQRLGLEMVLPRPRELFVDLDSQADTTHYDEMMALLADLAGKDIAETKLTESAGGNRHAYLLAHRFLSEFANDSREQAILRIALQACLGSDRKRELLSLLRILFRLDRPATVFFERPGDDAIETAPASPLVHEEDMAF